MFVYFIKIFINNIFYFRASVVGPPPVSMVGDNEVSNGINSLAALSRSSGGDQSPPSTTAQDLCSRTSAKSRPFLISNIMGLQEDRRLEGAGSPPSPMGSHHHHHHQGGEEDGVGVDSPGHSPGPDSDLEMGGDEDSLAKVF